ncbi:MAG: tRNA 2-thiouridine(34) synthase MnmA [Clostridia bacterium]
METVVVGMSGGVDSSVTAYLLKKQGYNVIGLFMLNWEETDENKNCTAEGDFEDVKRVCNNIGIPYYTVNYSKEYQQKVFSTFLQDLEKGKTPNPDVLCNREIKFGPFLKFAKQIGANYIATGHYAKIEKNNNEFFLKKAKDKNKDQSYFLNQLSQDQLALVLFPLQDITKPEVREIAKKLELCTAQKKDSTGICFIGERNFKDFLKNYLSAQSGQILTNTGKIVGTHCGLINYTIGQRKGLGIGGRNDGNGKPWYVTKKDVLNNILYVSQGENFQLFSNGLYASQFNWIPSEKTANEILKKNNYECFAKFRYLQNDSKVKIQNLFNGKIKATFINAERAITPGQYIVLYDNQENCLGGGVIDEAIF